MENTVILSEKKMFYLDSERIWEEIVAFCVFFVLLQQRFDTLQMKVKQPDQDAQFHLLPEKIIKPKQRSL